MTCRTSRRKRRRRIVRLAVHGAQTTPTSGDSAARGDILYDPYDATVRWVKCVRWEAAAYLHSPTAADTRDLILDAATSSYRDRPTFPTRRPRLADLHGARRRGVRVAVWAARHPRTATSGRRHGGGDGRSDGLYGDARHHLRRCDCRLARRAACMAGGGGPLRPLPVVRRAPSMRGQPLGFGRRGAAGRAEGSGQADDALDVAAWPLRGGKDGSRTTSASCTPCGRLRVARLGQSQRSLDPEAFREASIASEHM